jgi:hypothetical protein
LTAGEVRPLFLTTQDGEFAAAASIRADDAGAVTIKLKSTGTVTGRVTDKNGQPIEGSWFRMFFDEGPGRPGVFVHGGSAIRALTPAEQKRNSRIQGFYEHGFRYSLSQRSDKQGRFTITGVLPDVPFDLICILVGPPNAKGQRFTTGEVKIARPTVKSGQSLDLGTVQATTR